MLVNIFQSLLCDTNTEMSTPRSSKMNPRKPPDAYPIINLKKK